MNASRIAFLFVFSTTLLWGKPKPTQSAVEKAHDVCGHALMTLSPLSMVGLLLLGFSPFGAIEDNGTLTEEEWHHTRWLLQQAHQADPNLSLPVNLSKLDPQKTAPVIWIKPELHRCPQCIAKGLEERKKAQAREFILAEESGLFPRDDSAEKVANLDDPSSKLLGLGVEVTLNPKPGYGRYFLFELSQYPELSKPLWKKSWDEIESKMKSQGTSSDQIKRTAELFEKQLGKRPPLADFINSPDTNEFLGRAAAQVFTKHLYEQQSLSWKTNFPETQVLRNPGQLSQLTKNDQEHLYLTVVNDHRSDAFAENGLRLYEEVSASSGKDLHLRVGAGHMARLYYTLRTSLNQTPAGRKVMIKIDPEFLTFDRVKRFSDYPLYQEIIDTVNR